MAIKVGIGTGIKPLIKDVSPVSPVDSPVIIKQSEVLQSSHVDNIDNINSVSTSNPSNPKPTGLRLSLGSKKVINVISENKHNDKPILTETGSPQTEQELPQTSEQRAITSNDGDEVTNVNIKIGTSDSDVINSGSDSSAILISEFDRNLNIEELNGPAQEIAQRIISLQAALLDQNKDITTDLHFIHRAILEDPAQVTMMTEEQKNIFFTGLMRKTGAEITAKVAKSKATGAGKTNKRLSEIDVDDLL